MKHFRKTVFLCGILFTTAFSCEQDTSLATADAEDADIDFQFRLLNENGEPATTFQYGENFVFSFLIINNSDQSWTFLERLNDTTDFFRVYKINTNSSSEIKDKEIDMGKPWKTMFCIYRLGTLILPHDTLKLEIPWMPLPWNPSNPNYNGHFCLVEKNNPLNPGKYKTDFSSAFYFSKGDLSYITEEMQFHIEFEVKA